MIELPAALYHARPEANKSLLDLIDQAPAKAKAKLDGLLPNDPTPAMILGTAVHAAVLEPETLVEAPPFNRRTKEGKAEAEAFEAEHTGKVIVDPETAKTVRAMREGVLAHPVARRVLDDGLPERSVFATLQGVECKARPDWYRQSASLIADLKTTNSASPTDFAKSVANFRYHVQHAFYVDVCQAAGYEVRSFLFIAVEKNPPHLCAVYVLPSSDVERGRDRYITNLETLKACRETGMWPGYSDRIEVLSMPKWAVFKEIQ